MLNAEKILKLGKENKHIFVSFLLTFFLLSISMLPAFANEPEKNKQAASLYTTATDQDGQLMVEVWMDPGEQAINAAGVYLGFSTSTISAKDLVLNQDFCKLVIEQSVNNETGAANILCGLPSPGVSTKTKIAQITFDKVNNGWAEIKIDEKSMTLANDGLGTNLLTTIENKKILIQK